MKEKSKESIENPHETSYNESKRKAGGDDPELASLLRSVDGAAQYDACVKQLLGRKDILSHILLYCAKEFKGMDPKVVEGNDLGLLNIVLVGLTSEPCEREEGHELHRLLGTLLSMDMPPKEKLEILEDEYGIAKDKQREEEMNEMCNLSLGILERGWKKGIEKASSKDCREAGKRASSKDCREAGKRASSKARKKASRKRPPCSASCFRQTASRTFGVLARTMTIARNSIRNTGLSDSKMCHAPCKETMTAAKNTIQNMGLSDPMMPCAA